MRTKIICAVLAGLCVAAPASADDCKPLRLISSLPMTQVRNTDAVTVPVSLNGVEKQFLINTAGFTTQISESIADELKIPQRQSSLELYGGAGGATRGTAVIQDFAIGAIHAKNYDVVVSPMGVDGMLSPVANRNIDFELDFAAKKMNMFLSDHCEGKVVYWPSKALGVVPFTTNYLNQIVVPVTIDGHELKAIINTAGSASTIRRDKAESLFGLHSDSPGMTVVGHMGTHQDAPIFSYPFKTLTIGNIVVSNPHILIVTYVVNRDLDNTGVPGARVAEGDNAAIFPEVNIAMDVLRKLHLYLALREHKLYFTEAGAPGAATASPAAQPASTAQSQ